MLSVGTCSAQAKVGNLSFGPERALLLCRRLSSSFNCNVLRWSALRFCNFFKGANRRPLVGPITAPEALVESADKENVGTCESTAVIAPATSHGKKVIADYKVVEIPGDGRCLFRAVACGAHMQKGLGIPSERLQKESADALRAKVVDELVRKREETEWFIEGDFDIYIEQMRKPHVWGGEPELLMASHVLRMPITVYIFESYAMGLISIAEYGEEYTNDNPTITILYDGSGHYDTLRMNEKPRNLLTCS
ncbi:hypothetical protein KP509_1Z083500 [Ceratopteris richardii]|nr:hypothetical protein KP509_1Z083500 [Ceratopteris richardii]